MKRRFTQQIARKEILATLNQKTKLADLKQKTKLAEVRERNNELIDKLFESIFTVLISYSMSAIGFKTASYYASSSPRIIQWIADEKNAAALPWMINFIKLRPDLLLEKKYPAPIQLFNEFQKVLAEWDAEVVGLGNDELERIYGKDKSLLSYGIASDISKIIGTKDSYWINKLYRYGEYANRQGVFLFELKLAYLLAFSVPFIRHTIIEPLLKPVLHRLYNLRFLGDLPDKELTKTKVNDLLLNSEEEFLLLGELSKAGVLLNYILAAAALALAIQAYCEEGKEPAPELMIIISATLMKVIITKFQMFYQRQQQTTFENKINTLLSTYKDLLSFTDGAIELYKGKSLSDSYITYRATKYETLSDCLTNQIVKNALSENNVTIIEYTKTTHSFRLRKLSELEVLTIKAKINRTFLSRIAIKLVGHTPNHAFRLSFISSMNNQSAVSIDAAENETIESAKNYFKSLKINHVVGNRDNHLNKLISNIQKHLEKLTKSNAERFTRIQRYRLNNLINHYQIAKKDEVSLLKIIKINPTRVSPQDKKSHMHIAKSIEGMTKHLSEILEACVNYENDLKDSRTFKTITVPSLTTPATATASANLSTGSGTLFTPSSTERSKYNSYSTQFAYKLLVFCDFEEDESPLCKNIQINALLFEIVDFMKIRTQTHAQLRKDPCENFSQYIQTGLTHSKDFISEQLSLQALTILQAKVINFSRALIHAVTCDNYAAVETNTLCSQILQHGRQLDNWPETITGDDTITYSLITGSLIQTFQTYSSPLPEGMLLAALRMVNLKAEIYDGYVQPLRYLEHIAQSCPVLRSRR
jgi:hypothetical protein